MVVRPSPAGSRAAHPEAVGRYELLLPIATGGMATVYLARSRGAADFARDVAVKLVHPHLQSATDFTVDLVEEAKLAVRIRHPNVIPVLDVGSEKTAGVFLVMDYVEGDSLSGLVRAAEKMGSALPIEVALRILLDALAGLHAAHELRDSAGRELGVVHRDFSPHNVLVGIDGIAKLGDFGIAKAATRLGQTQTGTLKGKFSYMSPEQARALPLDRRCDVWAAGVVAWELLARRRLYDGGNDSATLLSVINERPALLRTVRPELPAALERVVAHALTVDVHRRCPTAAAFARALSDAAAAADLEIADHDEVARHVQRLAHDKLERRRAAVAALESHRPEGTGSTRRRATVTRTAEDARSDGATDTSSVSTAVRAPQSRGRAAIFGVVGAAALATVVGALAYRSGLRAAESTREAAPAIQTAEAAATEASAPVASMPVETTSEPSAAPPPSPTPASTESASTPKPQRNAPRQAPAAGAPSLPPLVKNPYEKNAERP